MNLLILRIMLGIGIIGHAINMYCDRILSVFDKGMITLKDLTIFGQDDRLAVLMEDTPASLPMRSTILGAFAVWMELFGYSAIAYICINKT